MTGTAVPGARRGGRAGRALARLRAYGQFGFPFLPGGAPTPTARLRRLSGPGRLPRRRLLRPIIFLAMTLGWPIGALSTAIRVARLDARPRRLHRIIGAWRLALAHNVPPFEYDAYGLDRPAARAALHDYLYWTDLPALAALNARRGADLRDVQDKERFAAICAAHGLAFTPTLAAFRGGRQIAPADPFVPQQPELWVKNLTGKGGQDAALWRRDGDRYRDAHGRSVAAGGFADLLRARDCIVQPRLVNHPAIATITDSALASLRIVTGIDTAGHAALVSMMLYLPGLGRTTSIAGIACAIDPESGAITRALDLPAGGADIDTHPGTGERIIGRVLPDWPASVALALDAHERGFDRFVFLGWDIALTPDGPMLLETNAGWGALHFQQLYGPIGHTAFSGIVGGYV